MKWKIFKTKLKDWDIDIILILLVILCLLLNAVSLIASKNTMPDQKVIEVHSKAL